MRAFEWNIIKVFQSQEHHATFQREGYIVVDLLTAEELDRIKKIYKGYHPDPEPGFFTTTFNQDVGHRTAVHNDILSVVSRPVQELFEDYKVNFCSFITKAPGPKSELILHQDMSLVDESRYNGINIWCPLVDLTEENGAIQLLPRSHRLYPTYRGSSLSDIYDGVENEVKSLMQSLYLKAGQAVIFDQSIMHYSPPNLSDSVRPVINTFVTHKEAEIIISWTHPEQMPGEVERFRQGPDFMMNFKNFGHDIFKRPDIGESLGRVPYDFPKVTVEMLEEHYGPIPYQRPPGEGGDSSGGSSASGNNGSGNHGNGSGSNGSGSNANDSSRPGFIQRILRSLSLSR